MKKKSGNLFTGILQSILIGVLFYLLFFGVRATGFLNGVPILGPVLLSTSDYQVFLLSCFAACIYFSSNYLSGTIVMICAAVLIFIMIFWMRDKLPEIFDVFAQFFNSLSSLF